MLTLCQERRGQQIELTYAGTRAMAIYRLPLNEVVFDFYDRLKSVTRGYASFDYEMAGYEEGELVKLTILVNAEPVDALSIIVHKNQAESRGRALCERLKDLIPRQLFKIAIQAAIGGRIIARETISALRKDVLAKCYGGDISRKKKLLEKQKKGKKRMRQVGDVEIPQSAFIAALKMDSRYADLVRVIAWRLPPMSSWRAAFSATAKGRSRAGISRQFAPRPLRAVRRAAERHGGTLISLMNSDPPIVAGGFRPFAPFPPAIFGLGHPGISGISGSAVVVFLSPAMDWRRCQHERSAPHRPNRRRD